jgi:hypothetical protein
MVRPLPLGMGSAPSFCSSRADPAPSVSKLIRHIAYGGVLCYSRFQNVYWKSQMVQRSEGVRLHSA